MGPLQPLSISPGIFEGDLLVPIVPTGSATFGVDYKLSQQYIYLPLGDSSATVDIIPLNDDIYEGSEDIVLTLTSSLSLSPGTNRRSHSDPHMTTKRLRPWTFHFLPTKQKRESLFIFP